MSNFGAFNYGGSSIDQSTVYEGPTTNFFMYCECQAGSEYNQLENVLTSDAGGDYQVDLSVAMNLSGVDGLTNLRLSVLQYYVSDSTWWPMTAVRDSVDRKVGNAFSLSLSAQLRLSAGDKLTYRIENLSTETQINFEGAPSFSAVKLSV